MLINSIENFIQYLPTAKGSKWWTIEPYVQSAEEEIKSQLTGEDLFDAISALSENTGAKGALLRLICHQAYYMAVPFVDLQQTDNGFAVVSNGNLAPASKERIERLLEWSKKMIARQTDVLIYAVMSLDELLAEWKKADVFLELTNCLFFTGMEFSNYTKSAMQYNRFDFLDAKNDLLVWQKNIIESAVSRDLLEDIIEEMRSNKVSDDNNKILHLCRMFLGKMWLGKQEDEPKREAKKLLNNIEYELESNLEKYPLYKNSKEFALKQTPRFQNEQKHSTFFFSI